MHRDHVQDIFAAHQLLGVGDVVFKRRLANNKQRLVKALNILEENRVGFHRGADVGLAEEQRVFEARKCLGIDLGGDVIDGLQRDLSRVRHVSPHFNGLRATLRHSAIFVFGQDNGDLSLQSLNLNFYFTA